MDSARAEFIGAFMEGKQGKRQARNSTAWWVLCPEYCTLAEHIRYPVNQCDMDDAWMDG